MTTHGLTKTPEHKCWQAAKQRCVNQRDKAFVNYGGRGITMCKRWIDSFAAFYADMGPRPSDRHSIERIDNNGPYAPENCRWATKREQQNNNRRNQRLTINGHSMTIEEWVRHIGITRPTLVWRLRAGWSIQRALTEPVHPKRR